MVQLYCLSEWCFMNPMSPAVRRYLQSCRSNSVPGMRAYLTTIHCDPHWAIHGLGPCVQAFSFEGAKLICEYKNKRDSSWNESWGKAVEGALVHLISKFPDHPTTIAFTHLLLETNPQTSLRAVAKKVEQSNCIPLLNAFLPYIKNNQKELNTMFMDACFHAHVECVENLIPFVALEEIWEQTKRGLFGVSHEPIKELVENYLLRNVLRETVSLHTESAPRRKI